MPEQAWLDSLVAGETVAVVRGCGRSVDVARVERVTRGRKWLYVNGQSSGLRRAQPAARTRGAPINW